MGLNQQVRIQQRTSAVGDDGTPVDAWTDVCTLWADIRHLSGLELARADTQMSSVRASIRVRQRPGITAAMRVVYGSTVYAIHAVLPDLQDRIHMDLACEVVS